MSIAVHKHSVFYCVKLTKSLLHLFILKVNMKGKAMALVSCFLFSLAKRASLKFSQVPIHLSVETLLKFHQVTFAVVLHSTQGGLPQITFNIRWHYKEENNTTSLLLSICLLKGPCRPPEGSISLTLWPGERLCRAAPLLLMDKLCLTL